MVVFLLRAGERDHRQPRRPLRAAVVLVHRLAAGRRARSPPACSPPSWRRRAPGRSWPRRWARRCCCRGGKGCCCSSPSASAWRCRSCCSAWCRRCASCCRKPGKWMDTFRKVMAVPMGLTALRCCGCAGGSAAACSRSSRSPLRWLRSRSWSPLVARDRRQARLGARPVGCRRAAAAGRARAAARAGRQRRRKPGSLPADPSAKPRSPQRAPRASRCSCGSPPTGA